MFQFLVSATGREGKEKTPPSGGQRGCKVLVVNPQNPAAAPQSSSALDSSRFCFKFTGKALAEDGRSVKFQELLGRD